MTTGIAANSLDEFIFQFFLELFLSLFIIWGFFWVLRQLVSPLIRYVLKSLRQMF